MLWVISMSVPQHAVQLQVNTQEMTAKLKDWLYSAAGDAAGVLDFCRQWAKTLDHVSHIKVASCNPFVECVDQEHYLWLLLNIVSWRCYSAGSTCHLAYNVQLFSVTLELHKHHSAAAHSFSRTHRARDYWFLLCSLHLNTPAKKLDACELLMEVVMLKPNFVLVSNQITVTSSKALPMACWLHLSCECNAHKLCCCQGVACLA